MVRAWRGVCVRRSESKVDVDSLIALPPTLLSAIFIFCFFSFSIVRGQHRVFMAFSLPQTLTFLLPSARFHGCWL